MLDNLPIEILEKQERMGREAFIRRFIVEHELMGYHRALLELKANTLAIEFM
ncbi:hypothetical protein [Kaarinaea lacus]